MELVASQRTDVVIGSALDVRDDAVGVASYALLDRQVALAHRTVTGRGQGETLVAGARQFVAALQALHLGHGRSNLRHKIGVSVAWKAQKGRRKRNHLHALEVEGLAQDEVDVGRQSVEARGVGQAAQRRRGVEVARSPTQRVHQPVHEGALRRSGGAHLDQTGPGGRFFDAGAVLLGRVKVLELVDEDLHGGPVVAEAAADDGRLVRKVRSGG